MSASQETERVNVAAEWPDKPAIYNVPPQDDTARFFHAHLMKLLRSGKKLDKEEMSWVNTYNQHKARSRNKEEAEEYVEEHTRKDLQLFFMDKISTMQNQYEERLSKERMRNAEDLAKKDKRIDELTAQMQVIREQQTTRIFEILSSNYKDSVSTVEKAHTSSNGHLTNALNSSTKLNETLTSGFTDKMQRVFDKEKDLIKKIQELADKEEDGGWFDVLLQEVIIPNKDKFGDALSRLSGPLLAK